MEVIELTLTLVMAVQRPHPVVGLAMEPVVEVTLAPEAMAVAPLLMVAHRMEMAQNPAPPVEEIHILVVRQLSVVMAVQ